jgi:hypothetical protein
MMPPIKMASRSSAGKIPKPVPRVSMARLNFALVSDLMFSPEETI